MKINFKFSNLIGTVYRTGNILFTKDGNTVIAPVGNKITLYDLANNRSHTLPIEALSDFVAIAISPDGTTLVGSQENGFMHIINLVHKSVIFQKHMEGAMSTVIFSPCGRFFAAAIYSKVRIFRTPSCTRRSFNPPCQANFFHAIDDITCIDWSSDSKLVACGSVARCVLIFKAVRPAEKTGNLIRKVPISSYPVVAVFFEHKSHNFFAICEKGRLVRFRYRLIVNKSGEGDDASDEREEDEQVEDGVIPFKKGCFEKVDRILTFALMEMDSRIRVTAASFKKETNLLVISLSDGHFGLIDVADSVTVIHTLNVSNQPLTTCCLNNAGDWVGIGIASLGQLLVWEWQSESHVLKQQGHFNSMRVSCYSPDALSIVTGGEDGKVKLWSTDTCFCVVTFSEHTGPVTGVAFTQSGKVIISSSLDGTVRAFDTLRYRNFRTLTSDGSAQFSSVTVDSTGDLVAAGAVDVHQIFLWALNTGQLLEVFGGHRGPVTGLSFNPKLGSVQMVSCSIDGSLKVWSPIEGVCQQTLDLGAGGTCLAYSPDGSELSVSTQTGQFWTFATAEFMTKGNFSGQKDLKAAKSATEKSSKKYIAESMHFTSLCYSPDSEYLLAGGPSSMVCLYNVSSALLVKRFQITFNRSVEGVENHNFRRPDGVNLLEVEVRKAQHGMRQAKVPGARRGEAALNAQRADICVTSLAFASTGRSWSACSTEGLLVYSLDEVTVFDPLMLERFITPRNTRRRVEKQEYSKAVMMACRLNIKSLIQEILEAVPHKSIDMVVRELPVIYAERLIKILASLLEESPHLGFYCHWGTSVLTHHASAFKKRSHLMKAQMNSLQKAMHKHREQLEKVCSNTEHLLSYLLSQASLHRQRSISKFPLEKVDADSDDDSSTDGEDASTEEDLGELFSSASGGELEDSDSEKEVLHIVTKKNKQKDEVHV